MLIDDVYSFPRPRRFPCSCPGHVFIATLFISEARTLR